MFYLNESVAFIVCVCDWLLRRLARNTNKHINICSATFIQNKSKYINNNVNTISKYKETTQIILRKNVKYRMKSATTVTKKD